MLTNPKRHLSELHAPYVVILDSDWTTLPSVSILEDIEGFPKNEDNIKKDQVQQYYGLYILQNYFFGKCYNRFWFFFILPQCHISISQSIFVSL